MTKNQTIQARARNLARVIAEERATPPDPELQPEPVQVPKVRRVMLKSARIAALATLLLGALAGVIVGSML